MVRRCTCGCVGSGGLFHGPDTDTVLNFPANRLEAYRKWVVDTLKRLVEDELAIAMAQMIFSEKIVVHFAKYHYPPLTKSGIWQRMQLPLSLEQQPPLGNIHHDAKLHHNANLYHDGNAPRWQPLYGIPMSSTYMNMGNLMGQWVGTADNGQQDIVLDHGDNSTADGGSKLDKRYKGAEMGKVTTSAASSTSEATSGTLPFHFVRLKGGASATLKKMVQGNISSGSIAEVEVFNCNNAVYEKLSAPKKRSFHELSTGVYTDGYRRQIVMPRSFNSHDEVIKIQNTLQNKLRVGNVLDKMALLNTFPHANRQQFHKDFPHDDKNDMFVIIPLQTKQSIYIKLYGNNVQINLKKDHAFVGKASLVHAGSETNGKRLHFEFVLKDGIENEKNSTYFEDDPAYPKLEECFKLSL